MASVTNGDGAARKTQNTASTAFDWSLRVIADGVVFLEPRGIIEDLAIPSVEACFAALEKHRPANTGRDEDSDNRLHICLDMQGFSGVSPFARRALVKLLAAAADWVSCAVYNVDISAKSALAVLEQLTPDLVLSFHRTREQAIAYLNLVVHGASGFETDHASSLGVELKGDNKRFQALWSLGREGVGVGKVVLRAVQNEGWYYRAKSADGARVEFQVIEGSIVLVRIRGSLTRDDAVEFLAMQERILTYFRCDPYTLIYNVENLRSSADGARIVADEYWDRVRDRVERLIVVSRTATTALRKLFGTFSSSFFERVSTAPTTHEALEELFCVNLHHRPRVGDVDVIDPAILVLPSDSKSLREIVRRQSSELAAYSGAIDDITRAVGSIRWGSDFSPDDLSLPDAAPTADLVWALKSMQSDYCAMLGEREEKMSELRLAMDATEAVFEQLKQARNKLDDRVRQRTAELAASLAELRQFTSVVAHDLKAPLRRISSYGEMLSMAISSPNNPVSPDRLIKCVQPMIDSSQRLHRLIDGIRQLSEIQATVGSHVELAIGEVLGEVLEDLEVMINEADATVTVGEMPTVYGHHAQLRLLFQNLVTNSIKFRDPDRRPTLAINAEKRDDYWAMTFVDNGVGIAPNERRRIFGMFCRGGDGSVPGTGVGLALCAKIVEIHSGEISVRSTMNQGSEFTVTLPVCREF